MKTKEDIQKTLSELIDNRLCDIGFAGDTLCISFGEGLVEIDLRDGRTRKVPPYSLHIECDWEYALPNGKKLYKYDLCERNQAKKQHESYFEKTLSEAGLLVKCDTPKLGGSITEVTVSDDIPNFELRLSDGSMLTVIRDSVPDEQWRFIDHANGKHFVAIIET